jgi:hypothetical protein
MQKERRFSFSDKYMYFFFLMFFCTSTCLLFSLSLSHDDDAFGFREWLGQKILLNIDLLIMMMMMILVCVYGPFVDQ